MRCITVAVISAIFMLPAHAADDTAELLRGERVRHFVSIRSSGAGTFTYALDDFASYPHDLAKAHSFAADSDVEILFHDFNPFVYDVNSELTEFDDVNYQSVKDLIDALVGLQETLKTQRKKETARLALRSAGNKTKDKTETVPCPAYEDIVKKLEEMISAINTIDGSNEEVTKSLDAAVGFKGVDEAIKKVDARIQKISGALNDLAASWKAINKYASDEYRNSEAPCAEFRASSLALVLSIAEGSRRAEELGAQLIERLGAIKARLEKYSSKSVWRGGASGGGAPSDDDLRDVVIGHASPTFDKGASVKLTITTNRVVALRTEKVDESELTLRFRHFSRIVPEVAVGVALTDTSYPIYGTAQSGASTVVVKAQDERQTTQAALLGNFVCRCWGESVVYPLFQVGVATAKERPALLAGLGLRFVYPKGLALTVGKGVTWYKDLDKLKIGDTVSGTAEIESDLAYRRSPWSNYVAIQYSWTFGQK